jgi:hypothetical protein
LNPEIDIEVEEQRRGHKGIAAFVILLLLLLMLVPLKCDKPAVATPRPALVDVTPPQVTRPAVIAARKAPAPTVQKMDTAAASVGRPSQPSPLSEALRWAMAPVAAPASLPVVAAPPVGKIAIARPPSAKQHVATKHAEPNRSVTARSALTAQRPRSYATGNGNSVASNGRYVPSHQYTRPQYRVLPDSYYHGLLTPAWGGHLGGGFSGMGGVHMGSGHMGGGHIGHAGGGHR